MNKNLRYVTAIVIASILLMWYALFNGYPLVTGDSGAYIRFTYDFAVLKDRSSFYSIWLALTGLRGLAFAGVDGTAWLPVFFQCLLVATLLLRYARIAGMVATGLWTYLVTVTLIAFLTGVSWTAAFIMPDIFTPVLLLAVVLYLFDDRASRWMNAGYLTLFGFAMLVHNSHFLVALLFCLLLLLYAQVAKCNALKPKLFKLLGVSALCWLTVCTINFMYGMGFTLSAGSHVYMAGKLVETGTMRQYLDEQCAGKDYKLCAYKNELPERAYEYIWNDNSPFHKIGGWENSAPEHKAIIRDIFITPRYAGGFARKAVEHTWMQFKNIHLPQNEQAFGPGSSPDRYISKNLESEISQFRESRQQRGIINNTNLVNIHSVSLLLSFLWVGLLWMKKKVPAKTLHIYGVVLIFLACNAFVTATFANVLERLQNRVFWVLPATNIMLIVSYYAPGVKKKHK